MQRTWNREVAVLVLKRREGEKIVIGERGEIVITLLPRDGAKTSIGIEAPKGIAVHRHEVFLRIQAEGVRKQRQKRKGAA